MLVAQGGGEQDMIVAGMLLALQSPPGMPPEVEAASRAWARCISEPLRRPLPPGQTPEQGARATIEGCAREQAALRVFLVRRHGEARGNREMDAFVSRSRQRVLEAMREMAAEQRRRR
jgi:hypothetical protein